MRQPQIGDHVEHTNYLGNTYRGEVDWVGSSQFGFLDSNAVVTLADGETLKGYRVMCLFNQEWKVVKKRSVSKREIQAKIKAKRKLQR